jgi:glycosyltransferase involved in cell wall biosynthesis
MKISVIVPVYNVEKYLNKCVDSIINQTYKDLEIILVNDGSNDRSGNICDEYEKKDNRVIVIHKENGGLSSARNSGLKISSGEFIGFIDSDDWIESNFFQLLIDGIVSNNADISVVHFVKVREFDKIEFTTETKKSWVCFNRNEAMEVLFNGNFIGYSAVNKLYRKKLFNKVIYPEGILMEDKATTYKLIHNSNRVVINTSQKYHYYLRDNSIIRSKFNQKNFDSFIIHEEIIKFIDINYPNLSDLIRARYVYAAIRMLLVMFSSNHNKNIDIERCMQVIRCYKKYAVKEKKLKSSVKLLTILFSVSPKLPYILLKSKIASRVAKKMRVS